MSVDSIKEYPFLTKIRPHIEWLFFLGSLIAFSMMDPTIQGDSFCFFERLGISYCPGEGLGHSMALFLNGEIFKSFEMHLFGPVAVVLFSFKILQQWILIYTYNFRDKYGEYTKFNTPC